MTVVARQNALVSLELLSSDIMQLCSILEQCLMTDYEGMMNYLFVCSTYVDKFQNPNSFRNTVDLMSSDFISRLTADADIASDEAMAQLDWLKVSEVVDSIYSKYCNHLLSLGLIGLTSSFFSGTNTRNNFIILEIEQYD